MDYNIRNFDSVSGFEDRNQHLGEIWSAPAYPLITKVKIILDMDISVTSTESPVTPLNYTATIDDEWDLTTRNFATGMEFGAIPYDPTPVSGMIEDGEFCLFWQSLPIWERIAMWTFQAVKTFQFTVTGTDDNGGSISDTWAGFIHLKGLYREANDSSVVHPPYDQNQGSRMVSGDSVGYLEAIIGVEAPAPNLGSLYSVPGEVGGWDTETWGGDISDMPVVENAELWRDGGTSGAFASTHTESFNPFDSFDVAWTITNLQVQFLT